MSDAAHRDRGLLRRAVEIGARGGKAVRPNPRVGCVLARDGVEIAAGWHDRCGGPHAETVALELAGDKARGATAYVTLEPCNHHGRTPPCAQALIAAGVARVVVGVRDPHPVAAGGVEALRAAGVEVELAAGAEAEAARELAEVFFVNVEHDRAFVQLKLAMSLDGRIAAADGTSRWITGIEARRQVHRLRAAADAVLIGGGTALADDPRLDLRELEAEPGHALPLRIVLDRRLRVRPDSHLADTSRQGTLVVVDRVDVATGAEADALRRRGVEVLCVPPPPDGAWLRQVLRDLKARGLCAVLCEGGGTLGAALLREGACDRLELFVAPRLLGEGQPVLAPLGVTTLAEARHLRFGPPARLGEDLWLTAWPLVSAPA